MRRDIPLAEFTTLKVGGCAELFAQPVTRAELLALVGDCCDLGVPYRVLARGSNLFVAGAVVNGLVIRLTHACRELAFAEDCVQVGASVPLQRLLTTAAQRNLGGMEYLHSVPGNLGGAVYMNAGRGPQFGQSVSNHVETVDYFDGRRVRTMSHRACRFSHRTSIFQDLGPHVILGARLRLARADRGAVSQALRARIEFTKQTQDNALPNAGSVFRAGLKFSRELQGQRVGAARYSMKTENWIVNDGAATSANVAELIERAVCMHAERGLERPVLEWIVWN